MIKKLHEMGVRSEHAYWAGAASIGLSILAWATSTTVRRSPLFRHKQHRQTPYSPNFAIAKVSSGLVPFIERQEPTMDRCRSSQSIRLFCSLLLTRLRLPAT